MMLIDENKKYRPNQPEYPYWITLIYVKNLKRLFPDDDIEKVLNKQTETMPKKARDVIRACATELFLNDQI